MRSKLNHVLAGPALLALSALSSQLSTAHALGVTNGLSTTTLNFGSVFTGDTPRAIGH